MPDRLAWPLRVAGGRLAVHEQDTDPDVEQCLRALLLTRLRDRPDLPDMGAAELVFSEQPPDFSALADILARHEPRAAVLLSSRPGLLDELVAEVRAAWQPTTTETTGA